MGCRHVEYFFAESWEKVVCSINRELKAHNWKLLDVIPLYKSPDIHTIIWYEACIIVEDEND